MNYSSRFFLYAPLALFLILAAGAGAMWWVTASALSNRLDAMNGHEAMPGITLHFKSKSVSGFPFNLDVVFQDMRIEVATPHGPSSWTAEKFALHALTYGREQMIFEAAGNQRLSWSDLAHKPHSMPFAAGELHASAIEGARGLSRVDIDMIGFGSPALTAARVQLHARVTPDASAVELFAAADAVHLSPRLASLFGDEIRVVRLNAALAPARTLDGLRAGKTDWVSAAETWRAANGTLRVSDLEIAWERLSMMGKGALTLDAAHAVEGSLDFKIAGMTTLIENARRRGVEGAPMQGIAKALLLRAAAAGNNEAGLLGAVVGFHGGVVTVGDQTATTEEVLY